MIVTVVQYYTSETVYLIEYMYRVLTGNNCKLPSEVKQPTTF